MHTGFWWKNLRESEFLHDIIVDERIILICVFSQRNAGTEWIDLAHDRQVAGVWHAVTIIYVRHQRTCCSLNIRNEFFEQVGGG